MPLHHDPVVAELLDQHRGTDAEAVIRRLCDRLLSEAGATVPVDMRMLASFRGVAEIAAADQDEAGCIYYDGERLVIQTRRADSEERAGTQARFFSLTPGVVCTVQRCPSGSWMTPVRAVRLVPSRTTSPRETGGGHFRYLLGCAGLGV